jgi:hypothetical protein
MAIEQLDSHFDRLAAAASVMPGATPETDMLDL